MKILIALLLFSISLQAMNLEEAIDYALVHRPDILAAEADLNSASHSSTAAHLWFLPQISGSAVLQDNEDIQELEIPGMGSVTMGYQYNMVYGLSVSVPLVIPQAIAGAGLSSNSEEIALYQFNSVKQNAVVQAAGAFYGILLAEQMLATAEEALTLAEDGFEIASLRYEAGTISRFELLQSEVTMKNRIPDVLSASNAFDNAISAFATAIGMDDPVPVEIDGSLLVPLNLPLPSTLDEARLLQSEFNPAVMTADAMIEMGDSQVDMAVSQFIPNLVFQTNYNFMAAKDELDFAGEDFDRSWTNSIALQIPLFNGFQNISGLNSARAQRISMTEQARGIKQGVVLQLEQAWNNRLDAQARVDATESTIELAEEAVEIAAVSFSAGTITQLDLDQANLGLTSAHSNYLSALFSLRMAEINLTRAIGILVLQEVK